MGDQGEGMLLITLHTFLSLINFQHFRIKSRRSCIRPNAGFLDQLALYQTMGCDLIKDNKQYRLYKLQVAAKSVKKGI